MEWIGWNLWSWATMLYPCSILNWDNSKADHIGVALAGENQNQDVGSKVIHIWKNTTSNIVSKSISKDWWIATYRWMVDIRASATGAINHTQCDGLIMDAKSVSNALPIINCENEDAIVAHEATAGKIDESQLFYAMSRGLEKQKAIWLIVNWFISPIVKKLPLEYAWELNRLIEMEMY